MLSLIYLFTRDATLIKYAVFDIFVIGGLIILLYLGWSFYTDVIKSDDHKK